MSEALLERTQELPSTLHVELDIDDAEVIAQILQHPQGRAQRQFIRNALRIGIMAIGQAQGKIDAQAIEHEGQRLMQDLQARLNEHKSSIEQQIFGTLREYFNPQDGRFTARIEGLIKQDGDIERLMTAQLKTAQMTMQQVLTHHLGENSPVLQALSPNGASQFVQSIVSASESAISNHTKALAQEFSLNNEAGALCRLLRELNLNNQTINESLQQRIAAVTQEFSLDNENSALSRLVKRVEAAQNKISAEFSLDSDQSALARLRRELTQLLGEQQRSNQEFQTKVFSELEAMRAKRKAEAASTTHGHEFEEQCLSVFQGLSQQSSDIFEATGSTTGFVARSRVGDGVITLNADSAAAGGKIVIEAKEDSSYTLRSSLDEIAVARQNRQASVGIFVHSKKTAPAGCAPLSRHGSDIIVLWDNEDESTDVWLQAALMTAKALCVRALVKSEVAMNFDAIDKAIVEVERQIEYLNEIKTWAQTIQNNSSKIIDRSERMHKSLSSAMETLQTQINTQRN